jgi:hypothetical protein
MAEMPHDRLKKARERAGFESAAAFARADARDIGISESGYRHLENGTRPLRIHHAKRFAKLLGAPVTWLWLLEGERADNAPMAEVVGYVGAGETVFPMDDAAAFEPLPAPPGLHEPVAAIVRGESMLPVYREGDILFFERRERVEEDVVGRDCMVQIVDGPRQLKRVQRGSRRGHFRLFSYASLKESDDTRLQWAAPVAWVMRA